MDRFYLATVTIDLTDFLIIILVLAGIAALIALTVVCVRLAQVLHSANKIILSGEQPLLDTLHNSVEISANLIEVSGNLTDISDDLAETVGPTLAKVSENIGAVGDSVGEVASTVEDFSGWLSSLIELIRFGRGKGKTWHKAFRFAKAALGSYLKKNKFGAGHKFKFK